ncbi:MAG: divalent-cation tolerance protein CutA [Asticcacaulis sp.]
MTDVMIVSITCASAPEAEKLAQMLVALKLAGCVQTHAIASAYVWEGRLEQADEVLLTVKTLRDRLPALEVAVKTHHSYEVPELIATRAEWVSQSYADWLKAALA